ncbi:hypothetical protein BDF21DRAFT_422077 [Thamnidium elegans]|nr:hypothetical protein BDF21DRAFT_422077 [Thamnidium elegans]
MSVSLAVVVSVVVANWVMVPTSVVVSVLLIRAVIRRISTSGLGIVVVTVANNVSVFT